MTDSAISSITDASVLTAEDISFNEETRKLWSNVSTNKAQVYCRIFLALLHQNILEYDSLMHDPQCKAFKLRLFGILEIDTTGRFVKYETLKAVFNTYGHLLNPHSSITRSGQTPAVIEFQSLIAFKLYDELKALKEVPPESYNCILPKHPSDVDSDDVDSPYEDEDDDDDHDEDDDEDKGNQHPRKKARSGTNHVNVHVSDHSALDVVAHASAPSHACILNNFQSLCS